MLLKRGALIAIEGIDGAGKSTLIAHLAQIFQDLPLVITKEPGGTAIGKKIRSLLLERESPLCNKTEFLLYAADRAHHFDQVIIPALQAGKLVISDRLADSSLVYQGDGRRLDKTYINTINRWAMDSISPDRTIFIRITPEIAYQRWQTRKGQITIFEQQQADFYQRLVAGFDQLYADRTDVIILDGMLAADVIAKRAAQALMDFIAQELS